MFTQLEAGTGMVWSLTRELDLRRVGTIDSSLMLGRRSAFVAALAAVEAVSTELNLPMPLKIVVLGGIGFRQDQLLALAIASNTTSTSMITTCVPLVITSQGMVAA